jgi:CHAD domain-containing protein
MAVDIGIRGDHDDGRETASWHKAEPPVLKTSTTAEQALADIVELCLEHLRGNEACVLGRTHDEGVHQMRVAVRRLRSSLALFQGLIPDEQRRYLNRELRWLINELGPARDWDVFIAETFPPVAEQLPDDADLAVLHDRAHAIRDQAYVRVATAIRGQRYLGIIMLLSASITGREWHGPVGTTLNPQLKEPAIDLANHLLEARCADVLAAGDGFAHLAPEDRHKLRIQVKKLRYATEFFGSLYPKARLRSYLAALKMLQDQLGASNDIEVARTLLKRLVKDATGKDRRRLAYASGLVVGWHSHVSGGRETRSNEIWERFCSGVPFWERPEPDVAVPESVKADAEPVDTTAPVNNDNPV